MTPSYILAILIAAAGNPVTVYFRRLVDPTFRGLYQANAFDLAIMLPYFFVMSILAMYGIHRYALVYNYFKHRKNVPGPPPEVTAAFQDVQAASIDRETMQNQAIVAADIQMPKAP